MFCILYFEVVEQSNKYLIFAASSFIMKMIRQPFTDNILLIITPAKFTTSKSIMCHTSTTSETEATFK